VLISDDIIDKICNFDIVDSVCNTSDHLPVSFCFNTPDTASCSAVRDYGWDRGNIVGFDNKTDVLSSKIKRHLYCDCDNNSSCCDTSHLLNVDIYYNEIVFALTQAADQNIPKVPKSAMKHYWSVALDDLENNSISIHRSWMEAGKPRQGI